ncbi:MAG: hypothetical protein WKF68_03575 [Daejeonella sp.]
MSQEPSIYPSEPEFSFKKIIADRKKDVKYLLKFKVRFIIAIVVGILGGAAAASYWPVTYTSRLTFIIEDSEASGGSLLAGLAGQFGFDMGGMMGGTSGVLAGENVMALLKSENMIKKTLLTPFPGKKNYSLADKYADSYKLKTKWEKHTKSTSPVMFPVNQDSYNRLQDSLLQDMVLSISEKDLTIGKPDKKLGFFELGVTTRDEKLSQLFSLRIIEKATDFYLYTKTKAQRINVERLQTRADSIGRLLNRKTYSTSAANRILLDANPAYPTANVGVELQQRDKMVLQTIYGEIIKNLEISRTLLIQETPTFQTVDSPELPLKKNQLKYPKGIVLGIILAVVMYSLYLLTFKKTGE